MGAPPAGAPPVGGAPPGGPPTGGAPSSRQPSSAAAVALLQEGLKYLEDLHVVEQQQQHAQRQLTMQHLLNSSSDPEGLADAIDQAAAEETERAAEAETRIKEALKDKQKRIVKETERERLIHPKVKDVYLLSHLLLQQMQQLHGRVFQPFTTLGVDTPQELQQHITASQLAPLAAEYEAQLARAPLHPPATDGRQRIQTLARPDPHDPNDPNDPNNPVGFVSLARFFEETAALPQLLRDAGNISGDEAAAQQQTLTAAAAAATAAAARDSSSRNQAPRSKPHALQLVAAEAAETEKKKKKQKQKQKKKK
ncbi:uncharacterized protein EMH_0085870 [Eimeria mitis]|uniref:Uncharacterized protein n=1 Tax=Eimeria mitis TaxID=44415 RepID=U6K7D1_9EIME|nr:uncharacterized protein EMH_0085870 [Eimeria mitis]CDJ33844.1 hypothetical protein EMH_0085870 [Eimeria mitis]